MAKNLLVMTVAGQLKWLKEAVSSLRDPLDVLVIDDSTPGDSIAEFCGQKGIMFKTKPEPMGLTDSWNTAYQYFRDNGYKNCILSNDDVRFPEGFSKGIFEGLKQFDLVGPLSNGSGTGLCQDIRRFVNIEPGERNIDKIQKILSERYKKAPFRQSNFVNGFFLAFSTSISKFVFNKVFLFNPANINTLNEYDLANRINKQGGKIGICKTSYLFHWKFKTTERLKIKKEDWTRLGDYREQLWR